MDGQSENLREPQLEPVIAGLAPQDELETDEVPDSMVSEFSSLTTPYCWVITEDAAAGYDGAEPSVVGKSGPGQAVAGDVTEALTAGRFFRLVDGQGQITDVTFSNMKLGGSLDSSLFHFDDPNGGKRHR